MKLVVLSLLAVLVAGTVVACARHAPPPLAPEEGRAGVIVFGFAIQAAALQCSANARHLSVVDEGRGLALADSCVRALVPARDAAAFILPDIDPWTDRSQEATGCAAKAVRFGLERVERSFLDAGYTGRLPAAMSDGIRAGRRLEVYALESCDPLAPTTRLSVFIDPRIAPCPPGACGPYPGEAR